MGSQHEAKAAEPETLDDDEAFEHPVQFPEQR